MVIAGTRVKPGYDSPGNPPSIGLKKWIPSFAEMTTSGFYVGLINRKHHLRVLIGLHEKSFLIYCLLNFVTGTELEFRTPLKTYTKGSVSVDT